MGNDSTATAPATVDRWKMPVATKGTLQILLNDSRDAIRQILPKHITPDRILKMALIAAGREAKIYECTSRSVVDAIMRASELGLDFSGTLGEGYIVPFKNKGILMATFIPGYRGYIRLARNSDQITTFEAHVVYEDDKFELEYGMKPRLVHVPNLKPQHPEKRIVFGAYAVVSFKDGSHQTEFMSLSQLINIRKRSKAKDNGPWVTDTDEMYRKTVVRRIAKYLPLSPEMEKLRSYDNDVDGVEPGFAAALIDNLDTPEQPDDGGTSDKIVNQLKSRAGDNAEPDGKQESDKDEIGTDEDTPAELLELRKQLLNMSGDSRYNKVPGLNAHFQNIGDKIPTMNAEQCRMEIANIDSEQERHEKAKGNADDGGQKSIDLK